MFRYTSSTAFNNVGSNIPSQGNDFESIATTCLILMGTFVILGCVDAALDLFNDWNSEE